MVSSQHSAIRTWGRGYNANVTEFKRAELRLETLAATDALTGIYNRRYFLAELDKKVTQSQREGCALSLISLDVDHFKCVNDSFGHATGDGVLMQLVERVAASLRGHDILGGEEFAVLLPATEEYSAASVAERLRLVIANEPFVIDELSIDVTTSLGYGNFCRYLCS